MRDLQKITIFAVNLKSILTNIKMKKLFLIVIICLTAFIMNAQKCAVLEFSGAQSVSVKDIDGITEMFMTYFRPAGYTMIERAQINKVISEQGFQRSSITDDQMVRLGAILNASKVVVGKVSRLGGQYQVDVRVVDAELGHDVACEGATFSGDYRANVRDLATKLAGKIAIKPAATVPPQTAAPKKPKTRTTVEVLYGYLKIFPKELGVFDAEPYTVIAQINKQVQYGYNTWRIPTNEELSLLKANNYLGDGTYMSSSTRKGIVLLVTDGDDYATVQAKLAEEEQKAKEEEENAKYVDLGLPSGTLWKKTNEDGYYYFYDAVEKYGNTLPTRAQWEELISYCNWIFTSDGLKLIGPNGNSMVLSIEGYYNFMGEFYNNGGRYWSSTMNVNFEGFERLAAVSEEDDDLYEYSWCFYFYPKEEGISSQVAMSGCDHIASKLSVRLVKK